MGTSIRRYMYFSAVLLLFWLASILGNTLWPAMSTLWLVVVDFVVTAVAFYFVLWRPERPVR